MAGRVRGMGAAAAWNPGDLTGVRAFPVADSIAAGGVWSDTGKTTRATLSGDSVALVTDPYSGTDWVGQATDTLRTDGTGKWWVEQAGGSSYLVSISGASRRSLGVVFGTRSASPSTQRVFIDSPTNQFAMQSISSRWQFFDGGVIDSGVSVSANWQVVSLDAGASSTVVRAGGATGTAAALAAGAISQIRLGRYQGGGNHWVGDTAAVIVLPATFTDSERTAAVAWATAQMPGTVTAPLIVWDGNSFVMGFGLATPKLQRMPNVLQSLLPTYIVEEYGVSGQTTAQMIADAATQVDPRWSFTSSGTKVIIGTEMTNAIYFNAGTAAAIYAEMSTFLSGRISAGATEAGFTDVIPRSQFDATMNTKRSDVNAMIDADFTVAHPTNPYVWYRDAGSSHPADWVIKASLRTEFATTGSSGFQGDGIHPSVSGAALYAADVRDAITGSP